MTEPSEHERTIILCGDLKFNNILECLICSYLNVIIDLKDLDGFILLLFGKDIMPIECFYKGEHNILKMPNNIFNTIIYVLLDSYGFDWTIENVQLMYDNLMYIVQERNRMKKGEL